MTPRLEAQCISQIQKLGLNSPRGSPKSSIYRGATPRKIDLGVSDYTLVSSGIPNGTLPARQSSQYTRKTPKKPVGHSDRFIARASTAATKATRPAPVSRTPSMESTASLSTSSQSDSESEVYSSSVAEACGIALNQRILAFQPEAPESSHPVDLRTAYNRPLKTAAAATAHTRRKIQTCPERVLDAPGLIDDYYLNLLDWSCCNQVAIGLERNVYVWNADTGSVSSLVETAPNTHIAGIKWSGDGAYLAVGLGQGDVQIYDAESGSKLRTMTGHSARVSVLAWDTHTLSTGCRDGSIWNHDVRIQQHKTMEFNGHQAEVCGLEWRADGAQLASGGNDNIVNIWDARTTVPKFTKSNHKAAVKAVAWCPWQANLLCTGGGSFDRMIHFWNTTTGARVNSIDSGSQVTSLKWSNTYKELVSSHGFPDNHISVWAYPTLAKQVDIPAHETRVLHSALSPDGQMLATAASDECLKMWKVFEKSSKKGARAAGVAGKGNENMVRKGMTIR